MKLQNKKTGEIVIADITHMVSGVRFDCGQSLAELNEEWEDYEEPEEYWFIDYDGGIIPFSRMKETATDRMMKQIGNYFDSREEAELAVRKLKAWKRLKDKGFSIYDWDYEFDMVDKPSQTIILRATAVDSSNTDLDLLFRGEE